MDNSASKSRREYGICLLGASGVILYMDSLFGSLLGHKEPITGIHYTRLLPMPGEIQSLPDLNWIWAVHAASTEEPDTLFIRCRRLGSSAADMAGPPLGKPLSDILANLPAQQGSNNWPEPPAACLFYDFILSYNIFWALQTSTSVIRGFSHRFGNALSSILGFAEIVSQRSRAVEEDPFAQRAMSNIFRGCEQIKDIIADTQVISARVPLNVETVDVSAWIQDVCRELATGARSTDIRHSVRAPVIPLMVSVDIKRLRELIQDLWHIAQHACAKQPFSDTPATPALAGFSVSRENPRRLALDSRQREYIRLRLDLQSDSGNLKDLAMNADTGPPKETDSPTAWGLSRIRGIALAHGGFYEYTLAPHSGMIIDVYLPRQ